MSITKIWKEKKELEILISHDPFKPTFKYSSKAEIEKDLKKKERVFYIELLGISIFLGLLSCLILGSQISGNGTAQAAVTIGFFAILSSIMWVVAKVSKLIER